MSKEYWVTAHTGWICLFIGIITSMGMGPKAVICNARLVFHSQRDELLEFVQVLNVGVVISWLVTGGRQGIRILLVTFEDIIKYGFKILY